MGMSTWADDPIRLVSQDLFGRAPFAKLISETINRLPVEASSTVFGLVGPWGSGKSSVAGMIGELLPDSWEVQSFTPWAASGTVALQAEFLAALDAALGGALGEESAARKALKEYAGAVTPLLGAIPGVGSSLEKVADNAVSWFTRDRPWSQEYQTMSTALKSMGKRVLVVCDDIDRLDSSELLEFLKVVRLLGRFPNIHYLIAYDADTVEDLLTSEGVSGRSVSFMEKIVQHPFELPALDYATRFGHVIGAIDRTVAERNLRLSDADHERSRSLVDALVEGLRTPRQISRFEQHLSVISNLIPGEVDILDFAALAHLRLNYHEVYESLQNWMGNLKAGAPDPSAKTPDPQSLSRDQWLERLERTSRGRSPEPAWEVLVYLFPGLGNRRKTNEHEQAFSDLAYTERYFSLGVAVNDVSDQLVGHAIASMTGGDPDETAERQLAQVIDERHESVARLAVTKSLRARQRTMGADSSRRRLIDFLNARIVDAGRQSKTGLAEQISEWLADEIVAIYGSDFDVKALLDLAGEQRTLGLLLRIKNNWQRRGDLQMDRLLTDFSAYFKSQLTAPGDESLEPLDQLRLKLTLLRRVEEPDTIAGLLDPKVRGRLELFEKVAASMVQIQRWHSGTDSRPELNFERDLWESVVSEDIRSALSPLLPEKPSVEELDVEDDSLENVRNFGVASARKLAVGPSADSADSRTQ